MNGWQGSYPAGTFQEAGAGLPKAGGREGRGQAEGRGVCWVRGKPAFPIIKRMTERETNKASSTQRPEGKLGERIRGPSRWVKTTVHNQCQFPSWSLGALGSGLFPGSLASQTPQAFLPGSILCRLRPKALRPLDSFLPSTVSCLSTNVDSTFYPHLRGLPASPAQLPLPPVSTAVGFSLGSLLLCLFRRVARGIVLASETEPVQHCPPLHPVAPTQGDSQSPHGGP